MIFIKKALYLIKIKFLLLLGEEDVSFSLTKKYRKNNIEKISGFYNDYSVKINGEKIIIKRVFNFPFNLIFYSLYYFDGICILLNDEVTITGKIKMFSFVKYYLIIWHSTFAVFIFIALILNIFLFLTAMLSFNYAAIEVIFQMMFILGIGVMSFAFGLALIILMKTIHAGQRKKMIEFCYKL